AAQTVFARLATFVGGWTLEAAEAICVGDSLQSDQILEQLGVLVDNSLVQRSATPGGTPRFGMLETVREFAEERLALADADRGGHARDRHAAYYLTWLAGWEASLRGPRPA
ncbi:MAG: transcriptional regulator, partial [Chloroflexi bacterium]|nr:transcriptional regulator [Chloroflexota bacterium]